MVDRFRQRADRCDDDGSAIREPQWHHAALACIPVGRHERTHLGEETGQGIIVDEAFAPVEQLRAAHERAAPRDVGAVSGDHSTEPRHLGRGQLD